MKTRQQADTRLKREVDYRLSKWIITNIEQLLLPEEIEEIWRELLSFYSTLFFFIIKKIFICFYNSIFVVTCI